MRRLLLVLALLGGWVPAAGAHEVRPAYLELRETAPGTWDVLWKVPARGDERMGVYVRLPEGTQALTQPRGAPVGGAWVERWRVHRPGGLDGQAIVVEGLEASRTDVLARVVRADGSAQTARLLPHRPSFTVEAKPAGGEVAATWFGLGVEHILGGVDHLLLVVALLLLVQGWKRLLGTITAFSVAHSLTLALAILGFVYLPPKPVEAVIALSIVFVAAEIVQASRGVAGITTRAPWTVGFMLGLLHGFGFAGAMSGIGLPQQAIPAALLFFNLGVEAGQLLFIGAVLGLFALARPAVRRLLLAQPPLALVPAYAIGGLAMFWVLQRVSEF